MTNTEGPLITIGGNIKEAKNNPIMEKLSQIVKDDNEPPFKIGVIPIASQEPEESGERYSDIFKLFDLDPVIINPENREEVDEDEMLEKARDVGAYFLTGGNQLRITTLLGGTELLKVIREKHENGCLIAGTSAGSVCMTDLMISYGESENAYLTGVVELTRGLHFLHQVVIDTHFTARGRFPRLVHVVAENPSSLGIGLGEDTAAVWYPSESRFEVIGSRNIVVVDGKNIKHTNVSEIEPDTPLHAEGITVHILSNCCGFDLEERKPWFPENHD